jgi:hypothetical protein
MFLNIPLIANSQTIRERRQVLIDENLRLSNAAASIMLQAKTSWSRFQTLESWINEQWDHSAFIKFMPMAL